MKMRTWSIFWNSEQYVHSCLFMAIIFGPLNSLACVLTHLFCTLFTNWDSVAAAPPHSHLAGLPGRRCQGGEQRGGGDSHEPPRKNHLRAHRQPSRQLSAHGSVTNLIPFPDVIQMISRTLCHLADDLFLIPAGKPGRVWAESPGDH